MPTHWNLRTRKLELGTAPLLMGIVNVTPDSFSDGGKFYSPSDAVEQALRMEDAGADIIDIGGESTRPYSDKVAVDEELGRIAPVLQALQQRLEIPISIDTSKSKVAAAAVELGAEIINDVTGLESDPEMLGVAAQTGAGVCAMHMQGTPQTMQDNPTYTDVVDEIKSYILERDEALRAGGVDADRICLDPGIGFGKTHEHNLELLAQAEKFVSTGRVILVGHSRKGFIAKLLGDKSLPRDYGTLGVSFALALKGVHVLRVHDVAGTRQAFRCFESAGGFQQ